MMEKSVRVWDLPTRIFHWLLAVLFIFLIVSGDQGDNWLLWHMRAGYAILGLLVFRVLWGIVGSHYARFRQFVVSPITALGYAVKIMRGSAAHHLGHNPAGSWMVLLLLAGLSTQALSGLFISDDILWEAPFYNAVSSATADIASSIHHQLQTALQAFVLLHIAAVLWHRFRYRDPLVGAMIHGRKVATESDPNVAIRISPVALIFSLGVSVGLVIWLWQQPI